MSTPCVPTPRAPTVPAWRRRGAAAALVLCCGLPTVCAAQGMPAAGGPALAAGEQAAPASALRLGLTASTHLVYEPRPVLPPNEFHARPPQQPALALEFKSPKKDQGPRSLLRVQLSGDSVLHFRPRGGGLTVTYRSQF